MRFTAYESAQKNIIQLKILQVLKWDIEKVFECAC